MDESSKPRMCFMAEWRDISLVRVGQPVKSRKKACFRGSRKRWPGFSWCGVGGGEVRCSPWLENIVAVQTRHPKAARSKRRFLVGSDRSGARLHFPLPPSEYLVFRVLSPRKRWGNRRFANSPIDIPILEGKCAPSERVPLLDFHGLPPKSSAQSKRGGSGPADIPLFNGEPTRVDTLKSPAVAYESLG